MRHANKQISIRIAAAGVLSFVLLFCPHSLRAETAEPEQLSAVCSRHIEQEKGFSQVYILTPGSPEEAGMDETVIKAGVDLYKEAVEKDKLRNVVLLAARRGKIVLHEAIGWKDKDKKIPINKNAMFRMASNTKPVIATGIAILKQEGRLKFDDNVRTYIKSFDNPRAEHIKIQHLLTHTSGLRIEPIFFDPLIEKSPEHPDAPCLQLEVNRFGQIGAAEPPGTSYSYSNAGYNTLGALIEIVSKKPLEQFLKEQIYQPLGMTDTYHHEVAEKLDGKLDRMSVVYYNEDGKWTIGWKPGDPPLYPFIRASGGMISTAMDYAIFCQMFLNGGIYKGKRILAEDTVKQMIAPHTASLYSPEESPEEGLYYGYGWKISKDGLFGHEGSDGTNAWMDPKNNLIVLIFTQSDGEKEMHKRFVKIIQTSVYKHPDAKSCTSDD